MNYYKLREQESQTAAKRGSKPSKASANSGWAIRQTAIATPLTILALLLATFWIVEIVDLVAASWRLDLYGIEPRLMEEPWRIAVAPFLHADFSHLLANSIPILILGYLIIIRDKWHFIMVFVVAALISGAGVWLLGGANTIHIGASGVVFGFMGYLLGRGFFERSLVSILFGVIALLLYGGILIGVLPGEQGVSWLGHLFGLLGGIFLAYLISVNRRRRKKSAQVTQTIDNVSS